MADMEYTVHSIAESDNLLDYIPKLKILICKPCGFAIQPRAISSHLKEKHKIYRVTRQNLLGRISGLSLIEPWEVDIPDRWSPAIPSLPILNGFVCPLVECDFLCVSAKRMKQHCSTAHRITYPEDNLQSAELQTIFRGRWLRYFRVHVSDQFPTARLLRRTSSVSNASVSRRESASFGGMGRSYPQTPGLEVDHVTKYLSYLPADGSEVSCISVAPNSPSNLSNHPDMNMSDLRLLHHYLSWTGKSLVRGQTYDYYTNSLPQMATSNKDLMHNLLATSALHLAICTEKDRAESRGRYIRLAAHHQAQSLPAYRAAIASASQANLQFIIAYSKLFMFSQCGSFRLDHPCVGRDTIAQYESLETRWSSVIAYVKLIYQNTQAARSMLKSFDDGRLSWVFPGDEFDRITNWSCTSALNDLQSSITQCNEPMETKTTLLQMVGVLHDAYAALSTTSLTANWDSLMVYTSRITAGYIELLERRQNIALAMLAHFCVLLKHVRGHWWMHNHDQIILSAILEAFSGRKELLEWPCAQIAAGVTSVENDRDEISEHPAIA